MKLVNYKLINAITSLIVRVSAIWTVVIFILYITKDLPYKWTSLTIFIISVIIESVLEVKIEELTKKQTINKVSKFKQQIEEMTKKTNQDA